jgi:hypothetical protein
MLQQVEGVQHRFMSPAFAPQRIEVWRPVVAGDHRLAVDQQRSRVETTDSGYNNCVAAHEPLSYTDKYPLTKNSWVALTARPGCGRSASKPTWRSRSVSW